MKNYYIITKYLKFFNMDMDLDLHQNTVHALMHKYRIHVSELLKCSSCENHKTTSQSV